MEIGGVFLREFQPYTSQQQDEEFDKYVEWLRDLRTVKYIGRKEYFLSSDKNEIFEYVKQLAKSPNDSFFKIMYNDNFIGTFKVGHINWETRTADMGIMIGDANYRGKGMSERVMQVGLYYAFNNLGLWKVTGGLLSGNIAMQKCFEKCGFKQEGCIRNYMFVGNTLEDHLLYGLLREEFMEVEQ